MTTTQRDLGLALPVRESIGFRGSLELAQEAERLGYRSLWTAEVSGMDALTVLSAYATVTSRVQLGTAVIAIQTRTPVMTAMSTNLAASILLAKVDGTEEQKRTELRHVKPFHERFGVKIGALKALPF